MTEEPASPPLDPPPGVVPETQPMPADVAGTHPGGGAVMRLELAWGRLRRRLLKTFRPGYVREMKTKLKGDRTSCPVEVIDDRDLKFHRNVCDCFFDPADDRFAWREGLPFARAGLAELLLLGGFPLLIGIAVLIAAPGWWKLAAAVPLAATAFVAWFFRDPERPVPPGAGVVVSPADGVVAEVTEIERPEFLGEPAVRIGIFLNVFNVHVNRMSLAGRIVALRYTPGKFLNALKPESARENERMELFCCGPHQPHRRFVIRQISGAIARRIVCEVRTGQVLPKGRRLGMIKFGSRTELLLPADGLTIDVRVGQKVRGAATVVGRYRDGAASGPQEQDGHASLTDKLAGPLAPGDAPLTAPVGGDGDG